jgi:hypothetical protein
MEHQVACNKFAMYQSYLSWLALLKQLESTAKVVPKPLEDMKVYLNIKVKEVHDCYMECDCTCIRSGDSYTTLSHPTTFRLGASWASNQGSLHGDVANHEDLEEYAPFFWPSRN